MSFLIKNENFVRIKFHSDMKGMSHDARVEHYNKYLKDETLKRLKDYFKAPIQIGISNSNTNADLFTENNKIVSQKKSDYIEVLNLLKDFEFENIVKSIYFENGTDELFYHLREVILESEPDKFIDQYGLLNFIKEKNTSKVNIKISDFLFSFFEKTIQLTLNDWNSENKTRHQTIHKLCNWIEQKVFENKSENEIAITLFHYTKYWNMYFSKSSDDIKRIFLLNKLSALMELKSSEFSVNINAVFLILEANLKDIFCEYSLPPFLITRENFEKSSINASQGYKNQVDRFNNAKHDSIDYFRNYNDLSFQELIKEYFKSKKELQRKLSMLIFQKMDCGEIPNTADLKYFEEEINLKNKNGLIDSQNFTSLFAKRTYCLNTLELD
ncbi:MAG: hypothetical protein Q8M29_00165 [Bacteroidota bacterium]|nr:hypothetical protein [Bacteroidota bacterium]